MPHKHIIPKLWKRQKGKCYICGQDMKLKYGHPNSITVDHVIPKSKLPGTLPPALHVENKRGCCYTCNQKKGDKPLHVFREELSNQGEV